jgi:hypothetical protein
MTLLIAISVLTFIFPFISIAFVLFTEIFKLIPYTFLHFNFLIMVQFDAT